MTIQKHTTWMMTTVVAAAVLLGGAVSAQADGRDRGRNDRFDRGRDDRGPSRVIVVQPRREEPRSGVRFGIVLGQPSVVVPAPATRWVEGYYRTETRQVLVEPGHYEFRTIERIVEKRYPSNGPPYTVVIQEGGTQKVWVPDRYETVTTQVWVPGYWESCPPPAPVVYQPSGVRINIGGIFRF